MLNVLLIEDDATKAAQVARVVDMTPGLVNPSTQIVNDVVSAKRLLEREQFDVLFLDIQIPNRFGQPVERGGGVRLLEEITSGTKMKRPRFIVGVTAYEDIAEEFEAVFARHLFGLVRFDKSSSLWRDAVQNLLSHAVATRDAKGVQRIKADLVVLNALEEPEHASVLEWPLQWTKLPLDGDSTIYHRGVIVREGIEKTVIAAACPQMGLPASASIAMKMILKFSPRFIAMTGIAAGLQGELNIGDVIVADPVWDYSNGKLRRENGAELEFLPEPVQMRLDPLLKTQIKLIAGEQGLMDRIRNEFRSKKPDTVLRVKCGPMASGPLVLAARSTGEKLREQNRKLCGVDMEAYGLFTAAMYAPFPSPHALSLKAVSDYADEEKNDDFRTYAAYASASVLYRWAERYL